MDALRGDGNAYVQSIMDRAYESTNKNESLATAFSKFTQRDGYSGYSLLIAAETDFAPEVRKLQTRGLVIALFAGACFIPLAWLFGGRMSLSLRRLTDQTRRLRMLASPDDQRVTSRIAEVDELGSAIATAQRTIWSFAHFVAADIVTGIIDGSISTELGGVRQEVTILFTDVMNFTGIAEAADPGAARDRRERQPAPHSHPREYVVPESLLGLGTLRDAFGAVSDTEKKASLLVHYACGR